MLKLIALSILALASPVAAADVPVRLAEHDGVRFEYRATIDDKDVIYLTGRVKDGHRFDYRVSRNGWVTDLASKPRLSFKISKTMRDRMVKDMRSDKASQLADAGLARH